MNRRYRQSEYIYRELEKTQNSLGGPDIYRVARSAFTAGLPGKSTEKIRDVRLDV
jgi:hypothetical protein